MVSAYVVFNLSASRGLSFYGHVLRLGKMTELILQNFAIEIYFDYWL